VAFGIFRVRRLANQKTVGSILYIINGCDGSKINGCDGSKVPNKRLYGNRVTLPASLGDLLVFTVRAQLVATMHGTGCVVAVRYSRPWERTVE